MIRTLKFKTFFCLSVSKIYCDCVTECQACKVSLGDWPPPMQLLSLVEHPVMYPLSVSKQGMLFSMCQKKYG